jgi:hypothetical protein
MTIVKYLKYENYKRLWLKKRLRFMSANVKDVNMNG